MANLRLGYLNTVHLIGRLTADPELKYTSKGIPVCTFRIAVSRRFKDRETGDFREDVSFLNVVAWRRLAEQADTFLKKGSAILIEGRLRSRSWETSEGQRRSTVEVVAGRIEFLDKKTEEPSEGPAEEISVEPTEGEGLEETTLDG